MKQIRNLNSNSNKKKTEIQTSTYDFIIKFNKFMAVI